MIRRKSEGNKEKSVCPTLARKRKNPKSWRIWKEKGREGRAGVMLSAPRHTRGNRADRGETRSGLHWGGEGPCQCCQAQTPLCSGTEWKESVASIQERLQPPWTCSGQAPGRLSPAWGPGQGQPPSSPGAQADPPCRAQGSGCSWSYRQVWQKLKNPKERHTG